MTVMPATAQADRPAQPHADPSRPHRVAMLCYPDAQILDVAGPLEVFGRSARWLRDNRDLDELPYSVEIIGLEAGPFRTSSGLQMIADHAYTDVDPASFDTLLVTGGIGWSAMADNAPVLDWLRRAAASTSRFGSICTGALILARAGLLEGHRATTHWAYCDQLRKTLGAEQVDHNSIFVRDEVYTSAGVTAGMDMALAMIEEDWDREAALAVARELVLYLKRPGGQAQFSTELQAQHAESDRMQDTLAYIWGHPREDLSVERLAEQAAMSPRNFARRFVQEVGTTPHHYVEQIRVDAARRRLESSHMPIKSIADRVGFGSAETMRRSFLRHVGISPSAYRDRFSASDQTDITTGSES